MFAASSLISAPALADSLNLKPASDCPGVYTFYGNYIPSEMTSIVYYIAQDKASLLACFKNSRMGGGAQLTEYFKQSGAPSDKSRALQAEKILGWKNSYIHSLGL